MIQRRIKMKRVGRKTTDGAGVKLTRVLDNNTTGLFDPFLMLDSFDATDPNDYLAGFPTHPHRGIETITYLIDGLIEHEDSLGNKDVILPGESQWMTAGSGILHQEMPKAANRMLGWQLWLNMSKAEKMSEPSYLSITNDMIPIVEKPRVKVHVISGAYDNIFGIKPDHEMATIYDIELMSDASINIPSYSDHTVFVFVIQGNCMIDDDQILEKTAVLFEEGEMINISTKADSARVIYFEAKPLKESISWGGPIVMNTDEELRLAFDELNRGTFIKHK
jgi:redox-sensitive bicupin YhaK (pirin superfamily)